MNQRRDDGDFSEGGVAPTRSRTFDQKAASSRYIKTVILRCFLSVMADPSGRLNRLKAQAKRLKTELHALSLAVRDPRVGWPARVTAGIVLAYAFSPIDLIPDFIPVLGYLDDLILVPLGIAFVLRLVPSDVMQACREKAEQEPWQKPKNWIAASLIVLLWLGLPALFGWLWWMRGRRG